MMIGIIRKLVASDRTTIFQFFNGCIILCIVRLKPIASMLPTTNNSPKRGMRVEATVGDASDNYFLLLKRSPFFTVGP